MNHPVYTLGAHDEHFPALLKELSSPPHTLYIRGSLPNTSQPTLAVVGTRKPSQYGIEVVQQLVREIARAGVIIVSGLALGIDALAHETALQENGITIAVLGGGIDDPTISPRTNAILAQRMLEHNGALISEYPPCTTPHKSHFPARNRIIAGLSHATLVIEGAHTSGSLITAKLALDYGRDVLAVPHPLTSTRGAGCNYLLQNGAHVVTCARDVLEVLGVEQIAQPKLSEHEKHILALCKDNHYSAAELAHRLSCTTPEIALILFELETKKCILHENGFIRVLV